jgi:hypothetical protein
MPKLDVGKLEDIKCEACGQVHFDFCYVLKKIPRVFPGNPFGREVISAIQAMRCMNCYTVCKEIRPVTMKAMVFEANPEE